MNKRNSSAMFLDEQSKDKRIIQLAATYQAFKKSPITMLQAARKTKLERASICWYVRDLKQANKIALVKKDHCPITKHIAGFYTTDPSQFPLNLQPQLF